MLTEDEITWNLYKAAKSRGSRLFFKVKHNLSVERDWSYICAPDVDLLEIKLDNLLVAYEIKGQRKGRKDEAEWPALYNGLGQALAYLLLPSVFSSSRKAVLFDGGAFDHVYLVNARPETETPEEMIKVLKTTPLGYITMSPRGTISEPVSPKTNPFKSEEAKYHLLQNLATLKEFSEDGRTFRNLSAKFSYART